MGFAAVYNCWYARNCWISCTTSSSCCAGFARDRSSCSTECSRTVPGRCAAALWEWWRTTRLSSTRHLKLGSLCLCRERCVHCKCASTLFSTVKLNNVISIISIFLVLFLIIKTTVFHVNDILFFYTFKNKSNVVKKFNSYIKTKSIDCLSQVFESIS